MTTYSKEFWVLYKYDWYFLDSIKSARRFSLPLLKTLFNCSLHFHKSLKIPLTFRQQLFTSWKLLLFSILLTEALNYEAPGKRQLSERKTGRQTASQLVSQLSQFLVVAIFIVSFCSRCCNLALSAIVLECKFNANTKIVWWVKYAAEVQLWTMLTNSAAPFANK